MGRGKGDYTDNTTVLVFVCVGSLCIGSIEFDSMFGCYW